MIRRRIVVLGKNRLAVECLRTIQAAGDDVVLALADSSDSGEDGWQPSFRRFASAARLAVRAPVDVNAPACVTEIAELRPDFLLSFQASQLLKQPLLKTPAMAAINLHFGPLPRYRGVAPIAWALINGEGATGVTLHHMTAGVDDGPVIGSKAVPISSEDTGRSVYDKCAEAGIDLFRESWPSIRRRVPAGIPQPPGEALYYNRHSIDFSQRAVSWQGDCEAIANRVRALIFPPFQFPLIRLGRIEFEVSWVRSDRQPHRGRPGEILMAGDDGITVAAPGGRVRLRLQDSGGSVEPTRYARLGIAAGAMLS